LLGFLSCVLRGALRFFNKLLLLIKKEKKNLEMKDQGLACLLGL
jgi:hypothetical protein